MQYLEMGLRGLMYVSLCLFCVSLIRVSAMLEKMMKNKNPIRGKPITKQKRKKDEYKESDEERKLRIELENIDAFYTGRAQREVE